MALVREKKRIGDMLINAGLLTQEQLLTALAEQKGKDQKLGVTLVGLGMVTEEQIRDTIGSQLGVDIVDLSKITIPISVINLVRDSAMLKKFGAIPYAFDEFDLSYLKVAMSDPMDIMAIDDLSATLGYQINPSISTPADISQAIDKYFGLKENMAVADQFMKDQSESSVQLAAEEEDVSVENAPIVQWVRKVIEQAVRMRASDIHIEPFENIIRVRYRVDGVLQEAGNYPINMCQAIIARIKIIGGMDIAEKRKPQDGRITILVDKTEIDVRVSVLPTVFGEKVVMRLAQKTALTRDKQLLGLNEEELQKFDTIFGNPNGIILVTGPTGSGKSTTLYTALSELNTPDVNIITVEDPVEANIDGINQVQVNVKADLTFATALRSILRQDPDIIMIGEIRDQETASIAVTASITGHLVVSTLHTNSASASISRLVNMGIERYLIADSVVGVIAQRLARKLCSACKTEYEASNEEKKMLGAPEYESVKIYKACGCNQCNGLGYKGRTGVYEIMPVTPKLRSIILRDTSSEELQDEAIKDGMKTLKMSCARLVREGVTTIEEMQRIVYSED